MPGRRQTDLCLTCGSFGLFSFSIGLTALMLGTLWSEPETPRYDANGTQLPSFIPCPSSKFLSHYSNNIQIIEKRRHPLLTPLLHDAK